MASHAIGDRANRIALDTYETVMHFLGKNSSSSDELRYRVEHAQILSPVDLKRFAELGVIPSMQPTHCTSDKDFSEQRIGKVRLQTSYAWASLLNSGVKHMPFGSDSPVESLNPFTGNE